MKIAIFDTNLFKFTGDMYQWWVDHGHEVRRAYTLRTDMARWADLLWFDCVDANLVMATNKRRDLIQGKRVVARCIDIDAWAGHFRGVQWDHVSDLVFIAGHIRDYVLSSKGGKFPDSLTIHHISCGVDVDRFTLRPGKANRDVAVVMKLWHGKGLDLLLQLIAALPEYHFHICGKWGLGGPEAGWYRAYVDDFLSQYKNWTHIEHVPDMNAWLDDKSIALLCSKKEAFSYATAEAAAKGLMPVVHHFYGAEDIWPKQWLWRTIDEAVTMIRGMVYQPEICRGYVVGRYSLRKMMEAVDDFIF